MKLVFPKGATSRIVTVFVQANNVTTGAGLGSLTNASSIVGGYVREGGVGVALAVDEDVTTEGTYQAPSAAGKVRIGTPANMRAGTYELHFHNDLWATGTETVTITLGGAANMADIAIEVQLSDPVRGLGAPTALPAAAADAAGGLPISDAGGLDLDAQIVTKINDILTDTGTTLDGRIPAALTASGNIKASLVEILTTALTETSGLLAGGFKKFFNVATPTGTVNSLADAVPGAAGGGFIAGTNAATVVTTSLTTTFTGNLSGSVGSLATQAKADVNAEVVDALATDTYAEPGQGTPAATASLATKIGYVYKNWRNRKTQTSTVWSLYNDDATTVDHKATVADDATTASKTEIATGP